MIQKRINTICSVALAITLAFALVIGPIGASLHAMHHIVRRGAVEFAAHNEAEHASHVPIDQHHLCGLCIHTKCADAIVATVPTGICVEHDSGAAFFVEEHAPSARDASTASSRAPPSLV